jgi:type IV secretion system protein VirB4
MVGIDLTAILDDETLVQPTAQYLLYRIKRLMDGRRGVLALDEAHAYMPHDQFKDLTEDCLLTARKNEWIIILSTQQPEHLLKGSFGATVVNQCMSKFVYRIPTADKKVWCGDMHFTEGEFSAISEGMLAHEVLLKRESGSAILNFDLSPLPECLKILSGRAKTVREVEVLREAHGGAWAEKFMEAAE